MRCLALEPPTSPIRAALLGFTRTYKTAGTAKVRASRPPGPTINRQRIRGDFLCCGFLGSAQKPFSQQFVSFPNSHMSASGAVSDQFDVWSRFQKWNHLPQDGALRGSIAAVVRWIIFDNPVILQQRNSRARARSIRRRRRCPLCLLSPSAVPWGTALRVCCRRC